MGIADAHVESLWPFSSDSLLFSEGQLHPPDVSPSTAMQLSRRQTQSLPKGFCTSGRGAEEKKRVCIKRCFLLFAFVLMHRSTSRLLLSYRLTGILSQSAAAPHLFSLLSLRVLYLLFLLTGCVVCIYMPIWVLARQAPIDFENDVDYLSSSRSFHQTKANQWTTLCLETGIGVVVSLVEASV